MVTRAPLPRSRKEGIKEATAGISKGVKNDQASPMNEPL